MRTEAALHRVRNRERALALVLENERDQGWPARFDWAAWRRNRATLVAKVRSRTYWADKGRPQPVESLGTE